MRKWIVPVLMLAFSITCLAASMPDYTRSVTFNDEVKIGGTVVKAGDYRVTHKMEGEKHVMIFAKGKTEVAKVECTLENLDKKASKNEQYYTKENGIKVLRALVFRGDTVRHNF